MSFLEGLAPEFLVTDSFLCLLLLSVESVTASVSFSIDGMRDCFTFSCLELSSGSAGGAGFSGVLESCSDCSATAKSFLASLSSSEQSL